mgnify:CR=1 FL=1
MQTSRSFITELKLSRKHLLLGLGLIALLLLPPVTDALGEGYLVSLFSRILIYALAALSLDLILGYGGMVSLGHAAYFGVGAYVVGILAHHAYMGEPLLAWPFAVAGTENALLTLPAAVLVSALFAAVIGSLCLRTRGMHFIMITLAFAQMLYFFYLSLETYGGDDVDGLPELTLPYPDYDPATTPWPNGDPIEQTSLPAHVDGQALAAAAVVGGDFDVPLLGAVVDAGSFTLIGLDGTVERWRRCGPMTWQLW